MELSCISSMLCIPIAVIAVLPYRILFTGKRTLSELVLLYLDQGNTVAAIMLYLIAKRGNISLYELREILKRLGLETSQSRIGSLLTTWKIHRFVESPVRGSYVIGPNLIVTPEELERTKQLIEQKVGVKIEL